MELPPLEGFTPAATSPTFMVEIVSDGGVGLGTYRVSVDGGQSWTNPAILPAGPVSLGDGVEVTLGGTWNAGDCFSIPVYRPIEYRGDTHKIEIALGAQSRLVINEVGSFAVGGDQGNHDLFQILAQLKSGLEANDSNEVGASLERLRSYEAHNTAILASLGASLNRVSMKENVYGSLKEELTRQISERGDTDIVEAVDLLKTKGDCVSSHTAVIFQGHGYEPDGLFIIYNLSMPAGLQIVKVLAMKRLVIKIGLGDVDF